jgi:uncharacterized membrane protein
MSAKQGRKAGTASRPGGNGTKARDKGTRGGRPEAQAQAAAPTQRRQGGRARGGNGGGRPGSAVDIPAGGAVQRKSQGTVEVRKDGAVAQAEASEDGARAVPRWLWLTTWILSVIGLADSTYLTIAHFTSSSVLACSDKGVINCGLVTTSPESELFGIFPVAVLGLAFYVFLAGVNSPWAWRARWPVIGWARVGSMIVGIVFVLYLVYTELFTLHGVICLYCTYVHIITFGLFGLTMFAAASGYGLGKRETYR